MAIRGLDCTKTGSILVGLSSKRGEKERKTIEGGREGRGKEREEKKARGEVKEWEKRVGKRRKRKKGKRKKWSSKRERKRGGEGEAVKNMRGETVRAVVEINTSSCPGFDP